MFGTLKRIVRLWRVVPPRSLQQFMDIVLRRNSEYYWNAMYTYETSTGKVRTCESIRLLVPLLKNCRRIVDFGCGVCGNAKVLAENLTNTVIYLVDHSEFALKFAREKVLGSKDERGNSFEFCNKLELVPGKVDAIICIEVLEHLYDYEAVLKMLWEKLDDNGVLIVSVPVSGPGKDRCAEHVNKFTCNSMVETLHEYSEWVSISPLSWEKKTKRLRAACFLVKKEA